MWEELTTVDSTLQNSKISPLYTVQCKSTLYSIVHHSADRALSFLFQLEGQKSLQLMTTKGFFPFYNFTFTVLYITVQCTMYLLFGSNGPSVNETIQTA